LRRFKWFSLAQVALCIAYPERGLGPRRALIRAWGSFCKQPTVFKIPAYDPFSHHRDGRWNIVSGTACSFFLMKASLLDPTCPAQQAPKKMAPTQRRWSPKSREEVRRDPSTGKPSRAERH